MSWSVLVFCGEGSVAFSREASHKVGHLPRETICIVPCTPGGESHTPGIPIRGPHLSSIVRHILAGFLSPLGTHVQSRSAGPDAATAILHLLCFCHEVACADTLLRNIKPQRAMRRAPRSFKPTHGVEKRRRNRTVFSERESLVVTTRSCLYRERGALANTFPGRATRVGQDCNRSTQAKACAFPSREGDTGVV